MPSSAYRVPALPPGQGHETELVIKRSRFITRTGRASTPEEAKAFIDAVRAEHADATHNCWAFQTGAPGSTAQVGCSDDGEPHGTAGRPMLNMLLHADAGELVSVVTRYFGGIKLGTGGLVRAYQDSVAANLESLPLELRVERSRLTLVLDYQDNDRVRRLLPAHGATVVEETFTDRVTLVVELPEEGRDALVRDLGDCTNGRARAAEAPNVS